MRLSKKLLSGIFLLVAVILFSNSLSAYMTSNAQAFQYSTGGKNNFTQTMCEQGQDFLIQIVPFGCTPAVVRTDLLEEQDVPVFCQLGATKINPLIDVEAIESISFSGAYPKEVSGIGFHPAKSALGVEENLNTPILENIGYVVITLRKQANASAIPDIISGNLTAKISYDIKTMFGIGKALFYIPEFATDEEWKAKKYQYSFWGQKGYLKVDEITSDGAQISVYKEDDRLSSVTLNKGETSGNVYIPGFECQAGLKLKLENLDVADTRAQLRVNSEAVEVAKGDKFLNNKCSVRNLLANGLVQKVGLRCHEDTGVKNFDLTISPKLMLEINGQNREIGLGERLYDYSDLLNRARSVYLGYIGTSGTSSKENLFVYLVSMPNKNEEKLTEAELASITSLVADLTGAGHKPTGVIDKVEEWMRAFGALNSALGRKIVSGQIFYPISFGDKSQNFGNSVSIIDFAGAYDLELSGETKEQYENAKEDYETIRESFSSEDYNGGTYGEEAFYQEIMLASDAGQKRAALELCKEFKESYPNSDKDMKVCTDVYKLSSQETGEVYVTINNQLRKISLDGVSEPSFEDYGARIMANTPKGTMYFDLRKEQAVSETGFSLKLISAEETSARVQISVTTSKGTKAGTVKLDKDITDDFEEGYSFTLMKINLKKVAKVSLIPNINNAGTQADFSFKIGVEKRAIQLSPDKVKETISNLDESIKKWSGISGTLGNVTKGLKTACLVTGAALVVKNFFANTGGTGIARQAVMRGTNGWFEKCTAMVSTGTYVSVDNCLVENADKIDSDVEKLSALMQQQNSQIKALEQGAISKEFLSEKTVDTDKFMQAYSEQVNNYVKDNAEFANALVDPSGKGGTINKESILLALSYAGWKNGTYSTEQARNIELYTQILNDNTASSELQEIARTRLYSTLSDIDVTSKSYTQITTWASSLNVGSDKINYLATDEKIKKIEYEELTLESIGKTGLGGLSANTPVALVQTSSNSKYIVILDNSAGTSIYGVKQVYDSSGALIEKLPTELTGVVFQRFDSSSYNHQYKNAELSYYETEPYKGMPAIVPFDLNKGWYAAVRQALSAGSNIASYEASGRVSSFYVCNVGENGLEENIGGDDVCQLINTGTGQAYNQFPGLSESEAKSIINKAVQAVEQASKISESQRKGTVSVLGQRIKVGEPAVDIPDFECQDFMSPKDCLLLFNVCDPVTCPSSRCDLGGAYPVKDVVQSGVVGSIALCLPNAKEGIILPVCLTGIKAGIDGFLSVKQSYRDCLQESLDTGKMVGICDEIYSIYICDFFWKQALPFADLIIPKIIEVLLGQNVRGGGEYLSVANAWEGADKAVNYFVNYYGTNSKSAFVARTTEAFVDNICKAYASAVVPSGADLIDTLTSPDSPVQFHGRFDEISMTTATVPPISHYKVFYHIYSGQDSGAYYQVYLKGASGSSYYQDTSSSYMVASGYVAVGGYASETKDFTATSGYKQLCINVNGQEECGFKEVSTSFALNYVSDKYLASQAAQTDIKTESECVSGTASIYSLLNPNAQSVAEGLVNPEIYNQGIIRICATDNPGLGTDPYAGTNESRWADVGYCGDTNIRCWIDTDSVKEVIKTTTVEGEALDEVSDNYLGILQNEGGYLSEEEYSSKAEEIKAESDSFKKITLINGVIGKVFWSSEKVELFYLRGNAYADIFRELWSRLPKPEAAPETEEAVTEEVPATTLALGTVSSDEATKGLSVLGLSDAQERVISATKELAGTSASRTIYKNCWDGAYESYREALVGDTCIYSDAQGKTYTIENEKGTGGETDIITTLYVSNKPFPTFAVYNCYYSSSGTRSLSSEEKLNKIEPGFLLSYAYRSDAGHNAVFIQWKDEASRIAYLFDWNGGSTENWVFRYYTEDLSDDMHPVYVYWQPKTETKSEINTLPIKEYPIKPEEKTSETATSTTDSGIVKTTIGGKTYEEAKKLLNFVFSPLNFVIKSLSNAGLSGVQGISSPDSLISYLENSGSGFREIDPKNLQQGDIIFIGRSCDIQHSIGIVDYTDSSGVFYYYSIDNKVSSGYSSLASNYVSQNSYVYRAYRYIQDLDALERNSLSAVREKLTLIKALEEVNKRTGKYTANKAFVDQLIFDGLLTEKECGDIRGTSGILGGLFNGEKDMLWVKKALLAKCIQDKLCKDTYGLS